MTAALTLVSPEGDTREVHPVAALFPMLAPDELADLAEDIKARGLLHPIVLDGEGRVLDGRNRLAAAGVAGVEPVFVEYDGADPAGYAWAVNAQRRNMTKGQLAIVAARARRLNGQTQRQAAEYSVLSQGMIKFADAVLDHAPDLADLVLAGSRTLNEAYDEARKSKQAKESEQGRLIALRDVRPDLADKVGEGEMTLVAAEAAQQADEKAHADAQRDATNLLNRIIGLAAPDVYTLETYVREWADLVIEKNIQPERFDEAIQILTKLREALWTSPST